MNKRKSKSTATAKPSPRFVGWDVVHPSGLTIIGQRRDGEWVDFSYSFGFENDAFRELDALTKRGGRRLRVARKATAYKFIYPNNSLSGPATASGVGYAGGDGSVGGGS